MNWKTIGSWLNSKWFFAIGLFGFAYIVLKMWTGELNALDRVVLTCATVLFLMDTWRGENTPPNEFTTKIAVRGREVAVTPKGEILLRELRGDIYVPCGQTDAQGAADWLNGKPLCQIDPWKISKGEDSD